MIASRLWVACGLLSEGQLFPRGETTGRKADQLPGTRAQNQQNLDLYISSPESFMA
jgi:hypothetical protein